MDEAEIFNSVINTLTEHNIRQNEYLIKYDGSGGFEIQFCPKRNVMVLDIMYFLNNIPDIKVFKVKTVGNRTYLVLKIKIRK